MAETILAGEEVEEFSFGDGSCTTTDFLAILPGFAENLLVCYRPSDAGYRTGYEKKVEYLG